MDINLEKESERAHTLAVIRLVGKFILGGMLLAFGSCSLHRWLGLSEPQVPCTANQLQQAADFVRSCMSGDHAPDYCVKHAKKLYECEM